MSIIGENESGKTTILKALQKFNQDYEYDIDYDVPINPKLDSIDSKEFLELTFQLLDEEKKKILENMPTFTPEKVNHDTDTKADLEENIEEMERKGVIQKKLFEEERKLIQNIEEIVIKKTSSNKYLHGEYFEIFNKYGINILNYVPRFVYFDQTHILNDFIDINTYLQDPNRYKNMDELLKFCGLDIQTLNDTKSSEEDSDEVKKRMQRKRRNLCVVAAKKLTTEIKDLWTQNVHTFDIVLDGTSITIQTSDDKNPASLDLSMKSKGIRWYVSFIITFDVQTKGELKNSILLFDEPSEALHPQAQMEFTDTTVCGRLIKSNQVIYATHSPFLLGEDLRVKIVCVERSNDGVAEIVKATEVRRKNTLLPLRALFGFDSLSRILDEDNILIVEGWNDKKFIELFNYLCSKNSEIFLNPSIYIIQLRGTGKIGKFISIFSGKANKIVALLDSDTAGDQAKKIIENAFKEIKIIQTSEIVKRITSEIEDLVPRSIYLKKFKAVYSDLSIVIPDIKSKKPVCEAIEIYFKKNNFNIQFDKQLVNKALFEELYHSNDPMLKKNAESLINTINERFSKS